MIVVWMKCWKSAEKSCLVQPVRMWKEPIIKWHMLGLEIWKGISYRWNENEIYLGFIHFVGNEKKNNYHRE